VSIEAGEIINLSSLGGEIPPGLLQHIIANRELDLALKRQTDRRIG